MAKNISRKIKNRIKNVQNNGVKVHNSTNKKVMGITGVDNFDYKNMSIDSHDCHNCYFKGKEPLLALYPKEGDCYPFMEGCEKDFSYIDVQEALVSYLQTVLVDFRSRESAEDFLQQMMFKILDYLDSNMGKTTPEKMLEYQNSVMDKVANNLDKNKYSERFTEWYSTYKNIMENPQTVVNINDLIDITASRKAHVEVLKEVKKQILKLENEKEILSQGIDNLKNVLDATQKASIKEREAHNKQVKGLMKELHALEADIRRMEQQGPHGGILK